MALYIKETDKPLVEGCLSAEDVRPGCGVVGTVPRGGERGAAGAVKHDWLGFPSGLSGSGCGITGG